MTVPDYETLMLPVLRAFGQGATSVRECLGAIQDEFAITDAEARELLPSGSTTVLSSRAHWARTYLSKAGLIASPKRGVHQITDQGRKILDGKPARIDNQFLRKVSAEFRAWLVVARQARTGTSAGDEKPGTETTAALADHPPTAPPEELIAQAAAEIEAALAADLLEIIHRMDPLRFERLVLDVLSAMGYGSGTSGTRSLTPATGDGGIDGIIYEDALGLDAVYVQAKRFAPDRKVGRPDIQQFVGSLTGEGATKGVFVTSAGFSADARDYLRRVQHRIVLIDGAELARRMIRHRVGVRVRQRIEIAALDADYLED